MSAFETPPHEITLPDRYEPPKDPRPSLAQEQASLDAARGESERDDATKVIAAKRALMRMYEQKESREFQEHEVIIPDDEVTTASNLLQSQGIYFEKTELSKKQQINENSWVPGEFVFALFTDEDKKPSPSESVKQIFQYLKDNGITVRYAKVPEN